MTIPTDLDAYEGAFVSTFNYILWLLPRLLLILGVGLLVSLADGQLFLPVVVVSGLFYFLLLQITGQSLWVTVRNHTKWLAKHQAKRLGVDMRHAAKEAFVEGNLAGEPDHVVESITGHLSKKMLQHYSHIRIAAKKAALDRLNESRKVANK